MSTLYLIRHGQASYLSENYDQLSALGERQAYLVGRYWAELGTQFDHVYIGQLRRQQQSHDAFAAAYQGRDLPWSTPQILPELDEHQAQDVMKDVLATASTQNPTIQEWAAKLEAVGDTQPELHMKLFQKIMLMWVRGELHVPGIDTWSTFRARVEQGLRKMMANVGRGQTVIAFTSGGVTAAAVGFALGLSNEQVMEMSWFIRNATYTEFRFTQTRLSLTAFNVSAHFREAELLTYV